MRLADSFHLSQSEEFHKKNFSFILRSFTFVTLF